VTQHSEPSFPNNKFHLAHGDLNNFNILIDLATGAVTNAIDWEMAGFRPTWLAAVGGGGSTTIPSAFSCPIPKPRIGITPTRPQPMLR